MPLTIPVYYVGTAPRIYMMFKKRDGTLYNPTSVTLTVKAPDMDAMIYTFGSGGAVSILNPTLGLYEAYPKLTAPGIWQFWYTGLGGGSNDIVYKLECEAR